MDNQSYSETAPYQLYIFGSRWRRQYHEAMQTTTTITNLLGILCNVPVIIIFFKAGLSSSSNICFVALGITDLCYSLLTSIWRIMDVHRSWSIKFVALHMSRTTTGINGVSTWITFIISLERLFCILFPLKMKNIITPKVTSIIILGYFLLFVFVCMLYYSKYIYFLFDDAPLYNSSNSLPYELSPYLKWSIMVLHITLAVFETGTFLLYGAIIVETILLIIFFKLKMKSRSSLVVKNTGMRSVKEKRLVRSVIAVCVFYILMSNPRAWIQAYAWWPSVSLGGTFVNVYVITQGVAEVFDAVNHSFNFFVFAIVNRRFRISLVRMLSLIVTRMCTGINSK